jgi:DNA-binding protein H-NS
MPAVAGMTMLVAALPLTAQTYKWKDARGQVHFTQVPPRNGTYEVITSAAPPPAAAPNQEALNAALQKDQKAAPEQQKAAEQAAAQLAQRQEKCKQALERVAYMDARTVRRLGVTDEAGNSSRMTQDDFDKQRAAWQQQADQNCN